MSERLTYVLAATYSEALRAARDAGLTSPQWRYVIDADRLRGTVGAPLLLVEGWARRGDYLAIEAALRHRRAAEGRTR